jgi:hypothetical protein
VFGFWRALWCFVPFYGASWCFRSVREPFVFKKSSHVVGKILLPLLPIASNPIACKQDNIKVSTQKQLQRILTFLEKLFARAHASQKN